MSLINESYFKNQLYIPYASDVITGLPTDLTTPNNKQSLLDLINEVEKDLFINALGLELYNEMQTAIGDIENPLYVRWKNLIQGEEYDGKIWEGLTVDNNLIANLVFSIYLNQNTQFYQQTGVNQPNAENSNVVSPNYKTAVAYQTFVRKYQLGKLCKPVVIGNFIDYYGSDNDNIQRSMYQYLLDKAAVFPEWVSTKFKTYTDTINSFDL